MKQASKQSGNYLCSSPTLNWTLLSLYLLMWIIFCRLKHLCCSLEVAKICLGTYFNSPAHSANFFEHDGNNLSRFIGKNAKLFNHFFLLVVVDCILCENAGFSMQWIRKKVQGLISWEKTFLQFHQSFFCCYIRNLSITLTSILNLNAKDEKFFLFEIEVHSKMYHSTFSILRHITNTTRPNFLTYSFFRKHLKFSCVILMDSFCKTFFTWSLNESFFYAVHSPIDAFVFIIMQSTRYI